jgi:hypothetical protein
VRRNSLIAPPLAGCDGSFNGRGSLLTPPVAPDSAELLDVDQGGQLGFVPGHLGERDLAPCRDEVRDFAVCMRHVAGVRTDAPEEGPGIGDVVTDSEVTEGDPRSCLGSASMIALGLAWGEPCHNANRRLKRSACGRPRADVERSEASVR